MSSLVRRILLDSPRARSGQSERPTPFWMRAASWLIAPLLLLTVLGGLLLLRHGPGELFAAILALVCLVPVVWGLVSVVLPSFADRRCPECHSLGLQPISEDQLHGVRCSACGHMDETASTWKFAEERDAPLEPLVLASRKRSLPISSEREDPA